VSVSFDEGVFVTETAPASPVDKLNRGVGFASLVIPLAVVAAAVVGSIGLNGGLAAVIVGPAAAWLYAKGAGAPLRRAAWVPFLIIGVFGVLLATAAGTIAEAYAAFTAVSGDGGPLGSVFATTLSTKLANGDLLLPILVGLGLGAIGLFGALRGPTTATTVAPAAPATPATPASEPTTPTSNTPSPGIILNGKPLDPDAKG
jgi:hypothetical protein